MTQICIVGGILGTSGYDRHTRELANALSKYSNVRLVSAIPQNMLTQLTDKEVEMLKRKPSKDEINLVITHPLYWKHHLGDRNFVYLVWEGDKVPIWMIDECLNPDIEYIFCPSTHTRDAIINTIPDWTISNPHEIMPTELLDKIKIISHGVDLNKFFPKEKSKNKFKFLMNKGWRNNEDRGGIQYGIKAYLEEFNPQDNVELIVKINPAYGIPDINKLISELKPNKSTAPLKIIFNSLTIEQLNDLYNQCNVFLSPTRAEAFNMPCLEAMSCGLPVITTNFGGQSDYIDNTNGWIIGGELKEVKHELEYEGISWLTPNIEELKKTMRDSYNMWKDGSLNNKIEKCIEMSKDYTWDKTSERIKNLIEVG